MADDTSLIFDRSDTLIFLRDNFQAAEASTQAGTGTFVLTGENIYSGGTFVSGGILQIGDGGTTGSVAGPITANGGRVAFDHSDTVVFSNVIYGGLIQAGSGTLILTATNLDSGTTTIAAGTLQLGNGGTTGTISGSGFTGNDLLGNIVDNGTLVFDRADTLTYSNGAISGSGQVVQTDLAKTILFGTNTYTGGTTVASGSLELEGTIVGDITDNGSLIFDGTADVGRHDFRFGRSDHRTGIGCHLHRNQHIYRWYFAV